MRLEADQLNIDDAKKISTFTGNVRLTQGTLVIQANKIVVSQFEEKFKRGTATGQPASFRQKRDGLDEYVEGYGERIEYDSKNATIDLFGQARIKHGQDEVQGNHITYNAQTGVFQALGNNSVGDTGANPNTGRVHAIIQPENKSPSKTPAAPPALNPNK